MLVTKLSTSFEQICQDRLFSGSPYMTLFNFGAIRCASGNAIHISPEVIEFGTVGINSASMKIFILSGSKRIKIYM